MPRPNVLLASFVIFPACLFARQAETSQSPKTAPQHPPIAAVEPIRASLVLELDRAILVLKRGLKEHWATHDQYLTAFEKTPGTDPTGRPVTDAKRYVECAIGEYLPTHEVWDEKWDEGPPINVAVQRTIVELTKAREGQAIGLQPSPCAAPTPRRVVIASGVAVSMLRTKIDPVYPAEAIKNHVSGTVVLHVTISTKGNVESPRVISGPALLRQAALDTVQQWTYRPYFLNNMPVEFDTTVNVVFAPSR
ncbi:MAG: energy transducer TonB [Terracidiphilus sp.]